MTVEPVRPEKTRPGRGSSITQLERGSEHVYVHRSWPRVGQTPCPWQRSSFPCEPHRRALFMVCMYPFKLGLSPLGAGAAEYFDEYISDICRNPPPVLDSLKRGSSSQFARQKGWRRSEKGGFGRGPAARPRFGARVWTKNPRVDRLLTLPAGPYLHTSVCAYRDCADWTRLGPSQQVHGPPLSRHSLGQLCLAPIRFGPLPTHHRARTSHSGAVMHTPSVQSAVFLALCAHVALAQQEQRQQDGDHVAAAVAPQRLRRLGFAAAGGRRARGFGQAAAESTKDAQLERRQSPQGASLACSLAQSPSFPSPLPPLPPVG